MRILISAMLLASTAALGAPAFAQDAPHPHDGGGDHHDGGGDHHGGGGDNHGGGDHGRGGPPPGQAQAQAPHQPGGQGGYRPQGGQPNVVQSLPGGQGGYRPQPNHAPPQGGRDDPHFHGGGGFQGDRGPGNDPRPYGHPGTDGHDHDRPVYQNGRPGGFDNRGNGGRPGGYDRGPGNGGGDWNRGWRNDNRYDWQGWRNQHRDIYRGGYYRAPEGYGYGYRRFGIGIAIAPAFFAQQYWIADPYYYHLPPAYGSYRWVRYYNDALLIDLYAGVVVDSIPGFFY